MLRPRAVIPLRLNDQVLERDSVECGRELCDRLLRRLGGGHAGAGLWLGTNALEPGTTEALNPGSQMWTAFTAAASCIGNIGPGFSGRSGRPSQLRRTVSDTVQVDLQCVLMLARPPRDLQRFCCCCCPRPGSGRGSAGLAIGSVALVGRKGTRLRERRCRVLRKRRGSCGQHAHDASCATLRGGSRRDRAGEGGKPKPVRQRERSHRHHHDRCGRSRRLAQARRHHHRRAARATPGSVWRWSPVCAATR